MKANRIIIIHVFILLCIGVSCKKYLDKKPQQSFYVPTSLNDLQALLDNNGVMNAYGLALPEMVADNYYVTPSNWAINDPQPDMYTWNKDGINVEWDFAYTNPVYYSNVVLDQLPKLIISVSDSAQSNNIKGAALFYRAYSLWQIAQVYCRPYSVSASTDLGIVLRLTSSISEGAGRATVKETYDRIISDLKAAASLLPNNSIFPGTRPTIAAAYGALAKVYLSMRDYPNAGSYANLCLQKNGALLNYNSLNAASTVPFSTIVPNPERIYFETGYPEALLSQSVAIIDSSLYASYDINDLRKACFFRKISNLWHFKGGYGFSPAKVFTGIATDEEYLIRAECYARAGNKDAALSDLNTLMIKRWSNNGTWVPFTATDATDALNKILIERRKELVYRSVRWTDLRRFNLDGANLTLHRSLNSTLYSLPPNDLRWVLLIPKEEISRSGIPQNPR